MEDLHATADEYGQLERGIAAGTGAQLRLIALGAREMHRYIAFLRGINVGGHRVKMDRLRSLFEELEFQDVSTFIASGNVIFSTEAQDRDSVGRTIESHLEESLGYEVATFLRTPAELLGIASEEPLEDATEEGSFDSHYVIFLSETASPALQSDLKALESDSDRFRFYSAEIHWHIRGKVSESPLFGGTWSELPGPRQRPCET